jgi:hypothetical protein
MKNKQFYADDRDQSAISTERVSKITETQNGDPASGFRM